MENMKKKNIGYVAPQYYNAKEYMECPNNETINEVLKVYTIEAKSMEQPIWYEKYVSLYFTYEDECYVIGPDSIETTPEIFMCLSDKIIDSLYKVGAYEMYCSGMLD